MAPGKLRQALGVVKDQTSISIAKVAGTKSPDLDVALVKACSHDEFFDDRYVEEVLHLTSLSRGYINACVVGLNRRLTKTHNWIVALKSLMLIHRLLRDGDPVFEQEMLRASRHGMRMLNLSYFRDDSDPHAWDYSSFVRTFGLFLDDRIDCSIFGNSSDRRRSRSHRSANRSRSSYRNSSGDSSPSRFHSRPAYDWTSPSPSRSNDSRSGYTYSDDRRYSGGGGGGGGYHDERRSPRYSERNDRFESRSALLSDYLLFGISLLHVFLGFFVVSGFAVSTAGFVTGNFWRKRRYSKKGFKNR
jgi:hypothetical protein